MPEGIPNLRDLYRDVAQAIGDPRAVYCRTCGREREVDSSYCLRHGWPLCCGHTMTIDKPEDLPDEG